MSDYNIQIMNDEMLPDLQILFNSIYPNDPCTVRKLLYKEDHPNHVVTLVARSQKELIGQANIFQKDLLGGIINIGCHVAENYRRQGVGTKLTEEAIKIAIKKGCQKFHIITEVRNLPSKRLAEKLTFSKSKNSSIDGHVIYYKNFG